ncbi:MAG: GntR family transcriptional regulator [Planctomycetota bacterium]
MPATVLPPTPDAPGSSTLARHRVRDGIQRLILSGAYQPGQRLVQQELAARFGVAQSVVRESLLELQFCGLVRAVDNLGMFVSGLEPQTLLDAYRIREMLEGLAARLCCETASRADLRELTDLAEQVRDRGAAADYEAMGAADRAFHLRMIVASQNQLLLRLTESYQVLGMFVRASRPMKAVHDEHRRLVEVIAANEPDEAERLARAHVREARESIERQLAQGNFVPQAVGAAAVQAPLLSNLNAEPSPARGRKAAAKRRSTKSTSTKGKRR